jgi:hypothetical protein
LLETKALGFMNRFQIRQNPDARIRIARLCRISIALVLALVGFGPILICQSEGQTERIDVPMYSARATTIYVGKSATSPDRKRTVSIGPVDLDSDDEPANVTVHTERGDWSTTIRFGLDTEILWSPDSESFAITGSNGGANGQYETDVVFVYAGYIRVVKLTLLIERAFGHPVDCWMPEFPNVGAIRWLVPSKELLVAAEIVHHGNCDSSGTFRAYVVDLAGPIVVRSINQTRTRKLYSEDLGEELAQADDDCIRNPKSCVLGSYHKKEKK